MKLKNFMKIANTSQNRNTFISYIPHKHTRSRYISQIDNRKNNPAFKEYKDLEIFPPEDIQVAIERKSTHITSSYDSYRVVACLFGVFWPLCNPAWARTCINQVYVCNPRLRRFRQEDQKLKAILRSTVNSRPALDTENLSPKRTTTKNSIGCCSLYLQSQL